MKRVTGFLACGVLIMMLGFSAAAVNAQDPPPDTPTPTPTYTPTPDYTLPLTLSSGQPARVVYDVTAGEFLIGVLLFVQNVFLVMLLAVTMRKHSE